MNIFQTIAVATYNTQLQLQAHPKSPPPAIQLPSPSNTAQTPYWLYSRVQRIWLFFRKWRIQTLWWVQNWNLRETFFAHLASKFAKSATMTPKHFFLTKIKKDIKKRRISSWFSSVSKNYCATNSGSPEVELRFCSWLILFKYWTGWPRLTWALLYVHIMYIIYRGQPHVTGPQDTSTHNTVKKSSPFSRPQPGCHWPNSSWAGII